MRTSKTILTAVLFGLAALVVAGGAALIRADEPKQPLPAEAGDVSRASAVEVRDASGAVVLQGMFGEAPASSDGDVERKATLAARDGSAASGEAEIEVSRSASGEVEQEVELDAEKLAPSAPYTLHLDGRQVASFTTDAKGGAEVELTSSPRR